MKAIDYIDYIESVMKKEGTFHMFVSTQQVVDYLWEPELESAIDYFEENGTLENHVFLHLFYMNSVIHARTEKPSWEQSCKNAEEYVKENM
jgi:hypothetical protein